MARKISWPSKVTPRVTRAKVPKARDVTMSDKDYAGMLRRRDSRQNVKRYKTCPTCGSHVELI